MTDDKQKKGLFSRVFKKNKLEQTPAPSEYGNGLRSAVWKLAQETNKEITEKKTNKLAKQLPTHKGKKIGVGDVAFLKTIARASRKDKFIKNALNKIDKNYIKNPFSPEAISDKQIEKLWKKTGHKGVVPCEVKQELFSEFDKRLEQGKAIYIADQEDVIYEQLPPNVVYSALPNSPENRGESVQEFKDRVTITQENYDKLRSGWKGQENNVESAKQPQQDNPQGPRSAGQKHGKIPSPPKRSAKKRAEEIGRNLRGLMSFSSNEKKSSIPNNKKTKKDLER